MSSGYPPSYSNPAERIRHYFSSGSTVSRLILANLLVFIVTGLISLGLWLFKATDIPGIPLNRTTFWLAVPADLSALLQRPWTLVSYMFFHEGFLHLLFNMVMLYFGGQIFREFLSARKLLATYIFGGLTGAAFYIVAYNVFPVFQDHLQLSLALGASASVLAILIAAATYVPDYTLRLFLIGNMKLKYIALLFVVLDLLSIQKGNAGGHLAHLGGAFWGFLFAALLKYGPRQLLATGKRKTRFRTIHGSGKRSQGGKTMHSRPVTDEEYNYQKAERQKRVDQILDKIAKGGYENLTREEKEFLFKSGDRF
ncbi:MAG TPA: rhomboid family intramembrane serine protease [Bacteroidales bacterium]|nr:rhomboid family intramembrane serine protease [Lentimicrobiaceae bacterium]HOH98927.1 rhomboid family intramembrane serine protease [Bacteroidales bacterium]